MTFNGRINWNYLHFSTRIKFAYSLRFLCKLPAITGRPDEYYDDCTSQDLLFKSKDRIRGVSWRAESSFRRHCPGFMSWPSTLSCSTVCLVHIQWPQCSTETRSSLNPSCIIILYAYAKYNDRYGTDIIIHGVTREIRHFMRDLHYKRKFRYFINFFYLKN